MEDSYRSLADEVAGEARATLGGIQGSGTKRDRHILDGFLYGQLSNAAKTGIWWVFLSPLIEAILRNSSDGFVGYSRLSFNLAMILLSPFAGYLAQVHSARHILNVTTVVRAGLYTVCVPVLWLLLDPEVFSKPFPFYTKWEWFDAPAALGGLFVFLMFCDGVCVAASNVVDVDCGGLDLVAQQHNIDIDDNVRNKFNSLHETVFAMSMIIVSPLFAVFAVLVAVVWKLKQTSIQATAGVVGALATMFFFTSLVSWLCYTCLIPRKSRKQVEEEACADAEEERALTAQEGSRFNLGEVMSSLWKGLVICVTRPRIRWRVVFFAIETALEDAFIMLMAPEFIKRVILVDSEGNPDSSQPHWFLFWQSILIAVGKSGGVLSALLMNRFWRAEGMKSYRPLFICVALGGIATGILPAGMYVSDITIDGSHYWGKGFALALAGLSCFLFFFFSTVPKIGFATLMQNMAAEEDQSGQIFGFIAAVVTAADSLAMLGMEPMFTHLPLHIGMWLAAGIYMSHGIIELFIGPCLILGPGGGTVPISKETLLDEPLGTRTDIANIIGDDD